MNQMNDELNCARQDRRSFMLGSFATALGLSSGATVSVAEYPSRGSQQLVRRFHPFSPERIIVIRNADVAGWRNRDHGDAEACTSMRQKFQLSMAKGNVICRVIQVMTDYYRVPHLFIGWATRLAQREMLGSTGIGHGFGYFHQFQDNGSLQVATPPVDWWLALFPEGINWESFDGEPVFGMIGHVFLSDHSYFPGTTLRTYCLTDTIGRMIGMDPINNWASIARLDKPIAARAVNQIIFDQYLSDLEALMQSADSEPAKKNLHGKKLTASCCDKSNRRLQ